METAVRLVITILFIVLIAVGVVFLGVFGLIPARQSTTVLEVEEKTIVRERFVDAPEPEESQVLIPEQDTPVRLDVEPGSPEAPQQSNPISEEVVPEGAIRIRISAEGIAPDNFEVESGSVVTLSVTSTDTETHLFKFKDQSLKAVAIGVGPGETRAITFNAPEAGSYDFFCDVPGHEGRGEVGVMTIR